MIVVPDDFQVSVDVYQFSRPGIITLPFFPLSSCADQATEFLKNRIEVHKNGANLHVISGAHELQVLRLLRHIREEVNGIKLIPKNLVFYFDTPDNSSMIRIDPTEDGDLSSRVPGGFFNQRFVELP